MSRTWIALQGQFRLISIVSQIENVTNFHPDYNRSRDSPLFLSTANDNTRWFELLISLVIFSVRFLHQNCIYRNKKEKKFNFLASSIYENHQLFFSCLIFSALIEDNSRMNLRHSLLKIRNTLLSLRRIKSYIVKGKENLFKIILNWMKKKKRLS